MSSSCKAPAPAQRGANGEALVEIRDVSLRFRKYDVRATFKQTVLNSLFRRNVRARHDFLLFQGLDLTVEHGQRLGIVGPNAAGKSTLLKLMAGVYQPSVGSVRVVGQVAPLIELGAGFNHELSGVENIYLKGALLGYGPTEMAAKIDRILDFAGLRDFANTPIKYYSTGMLLRLAFSVATDIEPEVLIIDEIFAGGDAEFVAKATQRMHRLMDDSHIVIIVSHDLSLIRRLCSRTVWLERGKIRMDGPPAEVCDAYLASASTGDGCGQAG